MVPTRVSMPGDSQLIWDEQKVFWQTSQVNSFFSVSLLLWTVRQKDRWNAFWHRSNLYDFSPMWIRLCAIRCWVWANAMYHISRSYCV